jgi:transcriptional regulator with XRE-family HTH domain
MFAKLFAISSTLRRARVSLQWTQARAADFLGLSQGHVSELEKRARLSEKHYSLLLEALARRLLKEACQLVLERRRELQHLAP